MGPAWSRGETELSIGANSFLLMMNLEPRTLERIAREFALAEQPAVIEQLEGYAGPEPGRVVWDILELSKGKLEGLRELVQAARKDYRDVLYWAEYQKDDPMFKGRDPRKVIDEILEKWGDKK